MSWSMASEEVLEIVQDAQAEETPYEADAHDGLFTQGALTCAHSSSDYTIVQCPAGLMQAYIVAEDGGTVDPTLRWEIELLDVSPMVA